MAAARRARAAAGQARQRALTAGVLEWDCHSRPRPGEGVCGDRGFAAVRDARAVAVAVDGVGHGPLAALAANRGVEAVRAAPHDDVVVLVERCHAALEPTRGAAIGIASFDGVASSLCWVGVGNVEGRLVRAARGAPPRSLLLRSGVLGHRLPPLRPETLRVTRGDLLLLATDGVDPGFADSLVPTGSCSEIAERVLEQHATRPDDALVLAARYLGPPQ
jgi:phosphoserine phosphatase RsbX